jgi:regulator of telomere elongation helicase 1
MAMCVEQWKRLGLWSKISALKVPYVEPKDKQTFSSTISTFYDTVGLGSSSSNASNGGAVFFAVFRGKASEGIDFSDTRGRAVILTGIPFASVADPRVKLKKQFLDENYREWQKNSAKNAKTGISLIDGQNWYKQQAARAVNQALGRVIRHRHDWVIINI